MKKQFVIGIVLTLVITALAISPTPIASPESDPDVTDLIAGQNEDAGDVLVWNDGDFLYIKFITVDGWAISETHVDVAIDPDDIPQKNGNPSPGKFEFKTDHDPTVSSFVYEIENRWSGTVYIATHAVVCKEEIISGGLEDLEASLPDQVTVQAIHSTNIPYDQSYFKVTLSGLTNLDGIYDGWCVDLDSNMIDNHIFLANVYSSYETIAMVEHPENLDLVNYILNQHYVGKISGCNSELYTFGDVQRAIWALIEDQNSLTSYLGPWTTCKADEIYADAISNGQNFIPECGEVVAIILEPANISQGQICIIEVPITCETDSNCETAWGDGLDFPGRNWATYFTYEI